MKALEKMILLAVASGVSPEQLNHALAPLNSLAETKEPDQYDHERMQKAEQRRAKRSAKRLRHMAR